MEWKEHELGYRLGNRSGKSRKYYLDRKRSVIGLELPQWGAKASLMAGKMVELMAVKMVAKSVA